ncbi:MAG: tRNA (N6-isopentenyl adenosine(37)-C2)-methylthiotransferase MiaB [Vicinamibacterales bacterium]
MARRYLIDTFGCQMNLHDAERMAGLLEAEGYAPASSDADADLVVINTCSVRERAEEKLYTRLGEVRVAAEERGQKPIVAVTGCVAQQEGDSLFSRHPGIDVVVGTQSVKRLPVLVQDALESRHRRIDVNPHEDVSFPLGVARSADPIRARVTIIEGCNEFCAFCVVPYTRGHERMRPVADILAEVGEAARTGHREVQLLGQIVNHYQAPDQAACDFATLLERVAAVPGISRVRFASPHPRHVSRRLMEVIRDVPQVCKHLHLPVQSGSNRILAAMRRRHTREHYLALVDELRDTVPGIALSTDMIVGFPGETAEDFEATLDLVARSRFHSMYSFKYSPRPNTLALKRMPDDVTEAEKTRRIMALQALQRDVQTSLFAGAVGTTCEVLIDHTSRRRDWEVAGRTSGNTVVNLPGAPGLLGELRDVRITGYGPNSLRGELARG